MRVGPDTCIDLEGFGLLQHLHLLSVSKSVDSSAPLAMHMKNVHHISQNNAGTPLRLSMRALDLRNMMLPWSAARKHKARLLKVDECAEPRYAARLIDTAQTSARLANACH